MMGCLLRKIFVFSVNLKKFWGESRTLRAKFRDNVFLLATSVSTSSALHAFS